MKQICTILGGLFLGVVLTFVPGYIFGIVGYGSTYGGVTEQIWLDRCMLHLERLRANCTDPDLQDVLNYTMRRYNKIGPFDVAVTHLGPLHSSDAIGCNNPLIPGMSVDIDLLKYPIHIGALTLVHEALHDYYPFIGHEHIRPREIKLEKLNESLRRLR